MPCFVLLVIARGVVVAHAGPLGAFLLLEVRLRLLAVVDVG